MIRNLPLLIRPAKDQDHHRLVNLIHFESHVHRHLDWLAPLDWIDHTPFLVAEQDDHLAGVLSCPVEPPQVAWVRLFAVVGEKDPRGIWRAMWSEALELLSNDGQPRLAALPLQQWFIDLLRAEGFHQVTNVVFLMWQGGAASSRLPSAEILPASISIRPMVEADIPAVADLDAAAFDPLWSNSAVLLEAALRQSAVATVAEDSQGIVGYQISTLSHLGGHLARLAVAPQRQGQRIGYSLLMDLLNAFTARGVQRISVNTQENNPISLRLYHRLGFRLTGEIYPVLEYPYL